MTVENNNRMPTPELHDDERVSPTYDGQAKALHWLVVALLSFQFITALLLPHIKVDTIPNTIVNLHFSFGIVIFSVMVVRWLHRCLRPVAVAPGGASTLERLLARAMHISFYVILMIGPFLGWASASAHNVPVSLFGLFELPAIAPRGAKWVRLPETSTVTPCGPCSASSACTLRPRCSITSYATTTCCVACCPHSTTGICKHDVARVRLEALRRGALHRRLARPFDDERRRRRRPAGH